MGHRAGIASNGGQGAGQASWRGGVGGRRGLDSSAVVLEARVVTMKEQSISQHSVLAERKRKETTTATTKNKI